MPKFTIYASSSREWYRIMEAKDEADAIAQWNDVYDCDGPEGWKEGGMYDGHGELEFLDIREGDDEDGLDNLARAKLLFGGGDNDEENNE